jgi:hypothetical protein
MAFPDITDKDFSEKGTENQQVHEMLDYAALQWDAKSSRRARLDKMYNAYNGQVDLAEIDSIVKTTGKKSKTKYVKYRLGRSKMKQLHGEFLEIPIQAQVRSVNRDAQNERMNKYKNMYGMALAKPQIEAARAEGYNVFEGMQIPDKNDKDTWHMNNFILSNELIMGTLMDDKVINARIKPHLYNNFVDLTIAAEVFGKNERDIDGVDGYRFIPAKYALYEESVFDPFLERTPYMGEVRMMYYHEILTNQEFNLTKAQKARLKEVREESTREHNQGHVEIINGHPAFPVYTIQWKGLEKVVRKISPAKGSDVPYKRILSQKYYNENRAKIKRDVKAGLYKIDVFYREILWTASRINRDMYTAATIERDLIQRLNENGKMRVDFDYTGMLFSTVNGYRVSMQEVVYELERIYDDIRFMMNKEIRKIRGDALVYDDAFLPKGKKFIDVLHSVSEDGVVRFNSSAEGNRGQLDADSNKVGIGALNLGQSQTLLVLLNQAMDIERIMDRITGMNESRQGLEKATATATTNVNNVEASRSMTYDLFYFMKDYTERVLMKLAEKTKQNKVHDGEDSRQFVLSDEEIQYLVSTKNLMYHNYAVTITDGRKEQNMLQKIETLFPQEINAGQLRSKDVAKFFMENNFAKAVKILDKAHDELAAIRQQEIKAGQEAKSKEVDMDLQISREDREDRQGHDKDMELLRGENKKEIEQMKGAMKATQDFQNNLAKAGMQKVQTSNAFE